PAARCRPPWSAPSDRRRTPRARGRRRRRVRRAQTKHPEACLTKAQPRGGVKRSERLAKARRAYLVDRVERRPGAPRELAGALLPEARVHDRAADGRAARRARNQDRADAAVTLVGGRAAAADAAVEEVRMAEADRVAELVGDDVLDDIDAERRAIEARADV